MTSCWNNPLSVDSWSKIDMCNPPSSVAILYSSHPSTYSQSMTPSFFSSLGIGSHNQAWLHNQASKAKIGQLQWFPAIQFTHNTQWMVMIGIWVISSRGWAMLRGKRLENGWRLILFKNGCNSLNSQMGA